MIWAAFVVAGKKSLATFPALVIAYFAMFPFGFTDVAFALGPHVLAGIGGVLGSAVRFHVLKMKWPAYPREAAAAAVLGLIFGQAHIPVITDTLGNVSPEMFPVAQGASIGILMAAGTGFLTDFIESYRNRGGGK